MATPKGRLAGASCLGEFIEEMKVSGFVASALARHGIDGAGVAPPGRWFFCPRAAVNPGSRRGRRLKACLSAVKIAALFFPP